MSEDEYYDDDDDDSDYGYHYSTRDRIDRLETNFVWENNYYSRSYSEQGSLDMLLQRAMGENDEILENSITNTLLAHVVFSPSTLSNLSQTPQPFISLIEKTVENMIEEMKTLIPNAIKSIKSWGQYMETNGRVNPEAIHKEICNMQPGILLPFYLKKHNMVLLLMKNIEEDEVTMSFFRPQPSNLEDPTFISTNQKIKTSYPDQAFLIKFGDLLKSKEFSTKLLSLETQNDTVPSDLLAEWLTFTLLGEDDLLQTKDDRFIAVEKSVRNEVRGKNYLRSGEWITLKTALHLSIVQELGIQEGTFIFKIFLVQMYFELMDGMDEHQLCTLDEVRKKLYSKISKLKTISNISPKFDLIKEQVFEKALNTLKKADEQLKNRSENNVGRIQGQGLNNKWVDELIKYLRQRRYITNKDKYASNSHRSQSSSKYSNKESSFCFDFEVEIRKRTVIWDPIDLRDKVIKYSSFFNETFVSNPLLSSRMVLTLLKCVKILDEIAIAELPILSEYNCLDFDTTLTIQMLLVATKEEMDLAEELETYFANRNQNCKYKTTTLISDQDVFPNSPYVRLAENCSEAITIIANYKVKIQKEKREKLEELEKKQNEFEALQISLRDACCTCDFVRYPPSRSRRYNPNSHPDYSCQKRIIQADIQRLSICQYVYPMPVDNLANQYAFAYEAVIPASVVAVRDVMLVALAYLCPSSKWDSVKKIVDQYHCGYYQVSSKNQKLVLLEKERGTERNINLNSRPTEYDLFVKSEGLKYNWKFSVRRQERLTYLQLSKMSPYNNLEQFLSTWTNSSNAALTTTNIKTLTQEEIAEFGCLRAGHRLQIRNIFRTISTESMSLNHDTFCLITQALMQLGPWSSEFGREARYEWKNDNFVLNFLQVLEKTLTNVSDNWTETFTLMTIITITQQIAEFSQSESLKSKSLSLIMKCRDLALKWINQVAMFTETSPKEQEGVRHHYLKSAICGALTFFGSWSIIQQLLASHDDVQNWLIFREIIFNEKSSEGMNIEAIFHRIIEMHNHSIGPKLIGMIDQDPSVLTSFAQTHPGLSSMIKIEWERTDSKSYTALSSSSNLFLDISTGEFLINGTPSSRLPQRIRENCDYQRIFGQTNFQISCKSNKNGNVYTTKESEKGSIFEFAVQEHLNYYYGRDTSVIITEKRDNKTYELVPLIQVGKGIPALTEPYSHWWNKEDDIVEFRPMSYTDINFTKAKYVLHLGSKLIQDPVSGACLINNEQAEKMMKILSLFESPKHILIWHEADEIIAKLPRHNLSFQYQMGEIVSVEYNMILKTGYKLKTLNGLQRMLVLEEIGMDEKIAQKKVVIPHGTIDVQQGGIVDIKIEKLRNPPTLVFDIDPILKILKAGPYTYAWLYLAALHAVTSPPSVDQFTEKTGLESAVQILQSGRCRSSSPFDSESLETITFLCELFPKRKMKEEKEHDYYKKTSYTIKTEQVQYNSNVSAYACFDGYYFILKKMMEESMAAEFLFQNNQIERAQAKSVQGILNGVDQELMARGYWSRIKFYNESAKVTMDMMPQKFLNPAPTAYYEGKHIFPMGKRVTTLHVLSGLCSTWKFTPISCTIKSLIYNGKTSLPGFKPTTFDDLAGLYKDIRDFWIQLYNYALHATREEWALILCDVGYRSEINLQHLLGLHAIAVNREKFPEPPKIKNFEDIEETEFNSVKVKSLLKYSAKHFWHYERRCSLNFNNTENETKLEYQTDEEWKTAQSKFFDESIQQIKTAWGPYSTALRGRKEHSSELNYLTQQIRGVFASKFIESSSYNIEDTATKMKSLFSSWENNYRLKYFVNEIDRILALCENAEMPTQLLNWVAPRSSNLVKLCGQTLYHERDPHQGWKKILPLLRMPSSPEQLELNLESSPEENISEMWRRIEELSKSVDMHAYFAGIGARLAPNIIFPLILQDGERKNPENAQNFILNLAIESTQLQRNYRLERYRKNAQRSYLAEKEANNVPRKNWAAVDYPEWLLLELEMDMSIREIQVKIAQHMMNSENGSKVTQLNMGEGKTSMIVPMIVTTLAQKKQECIRVTVLKSLHQTNYQQLKTTLGGMLGQMVHDIPCDRNLDLNVTQVNRVLELCQEIIKTKGVILTVPEYRLSWELRAYESYQKTASFCQSLCNLCEWKEKYCRDILDESDEILSPRYQKVYAMGASEKIQEMRWRVGQKLLKKIPGILQKLSGTFQNCIEISEVNEDDKFLKCRLLNYTEESDQCYQELITIIAEEFIESEFSDAQDNFKQLVKKYLTNTSFSEVDYKQLEAPFVEAKSKLKFHMTQAMAEFMTHPGILKSALNKRWRVNFGVDSKNSKMAVPFKAKDVAYEKTEFGHPSMAIILTELSYYYSGLTEKELDHCLDALAKRENPSVEFDEWVGPLNLDISYKSLNRDFVPQRVKLYNALKWNTIVIDFYLTHCVFPKELKCYPGKITTTAFDLAFSSKGNAAGFSGTDDTKPLLPYGTQQMNLKELDQTNEQVKNAVEKNQSYSSVTSWIPKGEEILKMLVQKKIRILIDVGALMIDLNNSQVADKWLELDETLEGVVFFDANNKRVVRTRKGSESDCDFSASPLSQSLVFKCAIYMDDEHTRGTDFKFPMNAVGCVTLGGRLPRDKFVQACMRMRSLESGQHTIAFIASKDVDKQIKKLVNEGKITATHVMTWVIKNSEEAVNEGLIFYSNNALNFVKKRAALLTFRSKKDCIRFGNEAEDREKDGDKKEFATEQVFCSVISDCFDTALVPRAMSSLKSEEIKKLFQDVKTHVMTLVQEKIPEKTCFATNLEEQQEREIELEKEVQVQFSPPVAQTPWPHHLSQNIIRYVKGQSFLLGNEGIEQIRELDLYASTDFIRVARSNEILRPVHWMVTNESVVPNCILLSPYEVNELLPIFWRGEFAPWVQLRMFSSRVRNGADELVNEFTLQLGDINQTNPKVEKKLLANLQAFGASLYLEGDEEKGAYKELLKALKGRFDVVKNIERRLFYFPENCDVRALLKW